MELVKNPQMQKMVKKHVLVVGAGGTIKEKEKEISSFLEREQPITIGINKMTEFVTPHYHLWTNRQRYRDLGSCIKKESVLMFKGSWSKKIISKHYKGKYVPVHYVDHKGVPFGYEDGVVKGYFRTAGNLAIMIAHVMNASKISIIGMDGFTLHSTQDLGKGKNQHCYGKGYTDDATWKDCIKKDKVVDTSLHELAGYGVKFHIITPTKFTDFSECQHSIRN